MSEQPRTTKENVADDRHTDDGDADDFSMHDDDVEWSDPLNGDLSDMLGLDLSGDAVADPSGLRGLIQAAMVSQEETPLLDHVFDRAARAMTTTLRQLVNESADVSLDDASALRFGEFVAAASGPHVIAVLTAPELAGPTLLALDGSIVFSLIDLLLGAKRSGAPLSLDERSFTKIELALVERAAAAMADALSGAFTDIVGPAAFAVSRIETNARFAAIADERGPCALAKFSVSIDGRGGRIAWALPHEALAPYRAPLRSRAWRAENGARVWRDRLRATTRRAPVEVKAVIAERAMSLAQLRALSTGDVVSFDADGVDRLVLCVNARAVAQARAGRLGQRLAARLELPEAMSEVAHSDAARAPEATADLSSHDASEEEAA